MPSQLMNVTPENVLQARAVILAEAQSFSQYLGDHLLGGRDLVGLCGGDPISRDAQYLFNKKVQENAVVPGQLYVKSLHEIADQLTKIAQSFGVAEQGVEDSFNTIAHPGSGA